MEGSVTVMVGNGVRDLNSSIRVPLSVSGVAHEWKFQKPQCTNALYVLFVLCIYVLNIRTDTKVKAPNFITNYYQPLSSKHFPYLGRIRAP